MGPLRVVFDTNTIISGIGWGGKPWQCLAVAFATDIEVIGSEETLDELKRVIGYEGLPFTSQEQSRYPMYIKYEMTIVDPDVDFEIVDDEDDNMFLEAAVEADADYLVSGDTDLTDLGSFRGINICPLADFLAAPDTPTVN